MKVLFDHQIFYKRCGGASKYFVKMIESMPADSWTTTTLMSNNEYVKATGLFKSYRNLFKGQSILLDYINRPYTNWLLSRQNFDIFHQTNFGTYCIKSLGNKPMVTTYHDSNLSTIDYHPEIVKLQEKSIKRADKIIVVSENTKKDLIRLFDVSESRVEVIYHGIDIPETGRFSAKTLYDFPYVLYVGRRSEYKNFTNFVKAFSLLREHNHELKAVCTFKPFNRNEMELFHDLGVSEDILYVGADEEMMLQLYHQAELFVFPSLYEGFGMPILESWACNCPVVLSDASCFPEIAGDAGLYFNPNLVEDIADKMNCVLNNVEIRNQLIVKGNKRVKMFSWKKCAEKHMQVYQSLV